MKNIFLWLIIAGLALSNIIQTNQISRITANLNTLLVIGEGQQELISDLIVIVDELKVEQINNTCICTSIPSKN